jgi:hypothetical protein
MAINWFGGPNPPADPSTFNYDTASQKVQRQKAAAQALQNLGLEGNQGQLIKNGDFIGYAGGNTLGSTIARLAASALGSKALDNADDSQKQLGQDSQAALSWAMDPQNSVAAQRAAAQQTQAEDRAADQREIDRMNNTVQGGDYIDPQAQQAQAPAAMETSPVSVPRQDDITPMPMPAPTATMQAQGAKLAAKVLGVSTKAAKPRATSPGQMSADDAAFAASMFSGDPSASVPAPAVAQALKSTASATPVTGGPESFGNGADFSRGLAPKANRPVSSGLPTNANYAANALGAGQNAPQATQPAPSAPALPPVAAQGPALPSAAPTAPRPAPMAQPMPPQAPSLEDRARAVGMDPTVPRGASDPSLAQQVQEVEATQKQMASGVQPQTDSRSMVEQAAANAQPTMADQIAQLQAIARTGPMGQQLATAQMNSLFGSKVGRYKTTVMADPVNGGFIKVTEDSATGTTSTDRIGSSNGTIVTGQTTDANGNRLNVHKDGSTSPMLDASGKPVVDSTVTARNDDQATKIGSAVQANATAQAAIDTALQRNQRILQLYNETDTGPVGGHLPNWTPKRQELQALLAQDLFGETRNALAGAGDAGGAPRMAQSEFKYMRDNGGLSQTTEKQTAANIIASMNAQLLAQKQALQGYAETLKSTGPGAAASGVPGRGQPVSAAQWGFK